MNSTSKHLAGAPNPWNPLANLLAQRYRPPFRHLLPSNAEALLATEGFWRRQQQDLKLFKRWLMFKTSGQAGLLCDQLPPPPARILWLNLLNNRIGDSVMDLSGRSLLGAFDVDLLTDKSQAELFSTDRYFKKVFTDPGAIDPADYDFALLDYVNTRAISLKRKWFPTLPFASIYGLFHVPVVNRTLFSCYRIHHLLRYPHSEAKLQPFLSPQLFVDDEPCPLPAKNGLKRVALTLGGMASFKTYRRWPEVIRHLRGQWPTGQRFPQFVLIGSQNGLQYVESVKAALDGCEVVSLVDALSLRTTVRLLAECDFYLGADGGLMHCANALKLSGVVLYGNWVAPEIAMPANTLMKTLEDTRGVNYIPPQTVAEKFQTAWKHW